MIRVIFLVMSALFLFSCKGGDEDKTLNAPIRYGMSDLPSTTDPHQAESGIDQVLASHLFLGLVTVDGAGQIAPGVAKSWVVSPDGLSYVFRLRQSTWSDGAPVTADTFVYSFYRLFDAKNPNPLVRDFLTIQNADLIWQRKKRVTALGVAALAPDVLEIRLDKPQPEFLTLLATPGVAPVPLHSFDKGRYPRWPAPSKLVVNGPYLIESMGSVQVRLKQNYKYTISGAEKRLPVQFNLQADPAKSLSQFLGGDLDIVDARHLPSDVLFGDSRLRRQLRQEPEWTSVSLALNQTVGTLRDSKLRTALAMMIDRQAMIESVFRQADYQISYSLVPPLLTSYSTPAQPDWAALTMDQRLADARRLLTEKGISAEHPLQLSLLIEAAPESEAVANYLADQLKSHGVVLTVEPLPARKFWRVVRQRKYQIALWSLTTTTDRPDIFFRAQMCGQLRENVTGYCNTEVDALLFAGMKEADAAKRSGAFRQAERLILQDMPAISLYVPKRRTLVSDRLVGWQDNASGRHPLERLSRQKRGL